MRWGIARRAGRLALLAGALFASPVAAAADEGSAQAVAGARLQLDNVLRSTLEHFPQLEALRAEREAVAEDLRAAGGAFDWTVGAAAELRPVGFYQSRSGEASLEVPTRLWGSRFFGGYRYGEGDVPSYEGKRITDEAGEVRLGVELPLLRGGRIDAARAGIERAELELEEMTPVTRLAQAETLREASLAYWSWLAAGLSLEIEEQLLAIAAARQSQIERRVERGAEARIALVDNQRLIVERRARLRGAERDFEVAAIRLSLYLRDDDGRPRRAERDRLPERLPAPAPLDPEVVAADLAWAREQHPTLEQLALARARLDVEAKLARNDLLPAVDLRIEGSRDFGGSRPGIDEVGKLSAASRSESELMAKLRFELPVQRREARGRLGSATARLARLDSRERLARERIVARLQQAVASLEGAYQQAVEASENARLARELRGAEQRRLELGTSNLIDVNIRELQAATAARQLVGARAAWHRARADYAARLARPVDPGTTPG